MANYGFDYNPVHIPGYGPGQGLQLSGGDLSAMGGWGANTDLMGMPAGIPQTPVQAGGFMDSLRGSGFLGSTDAKGIQTQGWGGMALGAIQGLGSAYMGMKQYGLAKDTLAQAKREFELNYAAQKQTTNASLEDRQRARVASNAGAYQSVGDYMDKNGVR